MKEAVFYVIGMVIHEKHINKKVTWKNVLIGIICLLALNCVLYSYHIHIVAFFTALIGIFTVCGISKFIETMNTPKLDMIGSYSMDIYVMANLVQVIVRSILLNRLHVPGFICCLMSVALGICIPIMVSKYFVRQIGILRLLVLGDYRRKER